MSDVNEEPPAASEPPDFDPPVSGAIFGPLFVFLVGSFTVLTLGPDHFIRSLVEIIGSTTIFRALFWFVPCLAVALASRVTLLSLRWHVRGVWRMFEKARDCGTSWDSSLKSNGYCQMNMVGERRQDVVQFVLKCRNGWGFVLSAALIGGVVAICLRILDIIATSPAMWGGSDCVVTVLVAVATRRRISKEFSFVRPTNAEIEGATRLHLKSTREQIEELISLIRRS